MHAGDLVALASAHGIDFLRIAGAANKPDGIAGKRRKRWVELEPGITERSGKRQLVEAPDTAKGKGSRVARPAAFSQVELGIAAYGVGELSWCAAQHSIARDRTPHTIGILHRGLMYHANKFAVAEKWELMLPAAIERDAMGKKIPGVKRESVYYHEALCMLVLDEISFRPAFIEAPGLHAIYLGVEESTWEDRLAKRFHALQMRYQVWYGSGLGKIQRRINGVPEDEPARAA